MIFEVENWLWKSNFGIFWHLPISNSQNSTMSSAYFDSYEKNLTYFVPPTWKLHNPYYHTNKYHAYKKFLRMNSVAHFVKCVPIQFLSSPRIPWFSKHGGFASFALRTTFLFFGQWKQTNASDILAKMNRKTKIFIWCLFVPAHNSKYFANMFKNH